MIIKFEDKFVASLLESEKQAEEEESNYTVTINPKSITTVKELVSLTTPCLFDLSRSVSVIPTLINKIDQLITRVDNTLSQVNALNQKYNDLQRNVDTQKTKINQLEAENKVCQESINDLKTLSNNQQTVINALKEKIRNLEENSDTKMKKCEDATLALERYSRDFNVRINNVKEEKGETPEITINKAKTLVKEVCGVDLDIEYGHRTGKAGDKPRTIIVKLFSRLEKRKLMLKRKDMFSAGFPMFNDLPKQDLEQKLKYSAVMKEKFQNKHKVIFSRGAWFVDGVMYKGE